MYKIFLIILCLMPIFCVYSVSRNELPKESVMSLVDQWSSQIENDLYDLSYDMSRKQQITESFSSLKEKIIAQQGLDLVEAIAQDLRDLMSKKIDAVQNIAEYAQLLSYYRSDDLIADDYNYYDADKITDIPENTRKNKEFRNIIYKRECEWWCYQNNALHLLPSDNIIKRENLFPISITTSCKCPNLPRPNRNFGNNSGIPMYYFQEQFDGKINFDVSVIKRAPNIDERDRNVLQGIRWTEALDLVFKKNYDKDSSLKYQYFASPAGFMRHYPAVKWPENEYNNGAYDPRTRPWYTAAMTSPKDMIILVDRSESITEFKKQLTDEIVNNILDTLNDNDFVNIYTMTEDTEPLVTCFNNTLVQANEENLRLFRRGLTECQLGSIADITLALKRAFELLEIFRQTNAGSQCNQAIMLITEGSHYVYEAELFEFYNWRKDTPVRIFTFQIITNNDSTDYLKQIACNNMGYHVTISEPSEIHEKVLNYLNVMSRAINYYQNDKRREATWSYLYADLDDGKHSNWLWKKRQREMVLKEFRQQEKTNNEKEQNNYDYMTTVSMPVYGERTNETELIGVAGVDVPIKLLKSRIKHHILGVNGYAFIMTNNGYILMHPGHRREFENILKPTLNTVDFLEEEILDDSSEPRLFDKSIVKKRVILSKRHYFHTKLGPFTLGIALPDHYGLMFINNTEKRSHYIKGLMENEYWKVHPEWEYCEHCGGETPEEKIRNCIKNRKIGSCKPLLWSLLSDAFKTIWFQSTIDNEEEYVEKFLVHKVFMATHSGLTRWKTFNTNQDQEENDFENKYPRAIDEDYYKRTVEDTYNDENMFIYSVPFETSGIQNNNTLLVTSTSTIFVRQFQRKIPVAVVGVQFNLNALHTLYINKTAECENYNLMCLIIDDNAYVVFSNEMKHTGQYIGDIRPDIMYHLVNNGVYKPTRMFDYQAICHQDDTFRDDNKSASLRILPRFQQYFKNIWQILKWGFATIFSLIEITEANNGYDQNDQIHEINGSIETELSRKKHHQKISHEKHKTINKKICSFASDQKVKDDLKAVPIPCDHEMWLFNLGKDFSLNTPESQDDDGDCSWPYVLNRIQKSNLIFLAINKQCKPTRTYPHSPTPQNIVYNYTEDGSLPCVIITKNNYKRKAYVNCYRRNERDNIVIDGHNCDGSI